MSDLASQIIWSVDDLGQNEIHGIGYTHIRVRATLLGQEGFIAMLVRNGDGHNDVLERTLFLSRFQDALVKLIAKNRGKLN